MKKRINVYLTDEVFNELGKLSEKSGLSKSAVTTMAVVAGIASIQLSLDPKFQQYVTDRILKGEPIVAEDYFLGGGSEKDSSKA